jgi:hypothetical protein
LPPQYDRDFDQIESYGSIIKDLTDTNELLDRYELRLIGKKLNEEGDIVKDKEPIIKNPDKAKEFVDMIRSVANQNTHFTWFDKGDILNTLNAFNYTVNRWLMFQGEDIPLRYRGKLSHESMNIIKASLHKAKDRTLLGWSKGSIKEGQQITQNPQKKGGFNILGLFGRNK